MEWFHENKNKFFDDEEWRNAGFNATCLAQLIYVQGLQKTG
jgi:hypothetical protein